MRTTKRIARERCQCAPLLPNFKLPHTLEQIRQRIHEIYLARGGAAIRELDDWLQSERELTAGQHPSAGNIKP